MVALILALIACRSTLVDAQRQGGPGPGRGASTPRAASLIDLTGYWVSVVTEDWRYRMVTPAKGDFASLQLTPVAIEVALAWDPARDTANGEQCKSYGAPAIMRVPGRLHISWQEDRSLKVETDAGTQTRLFRSDASPSVSEPRTWQGFSTAQWMAPRPVRGGPQTPGGSLRVVTSHLRPGYVRKNGVPYSQDAVLTEYFDVLRQANGERWLLVTSTLEDPQYLQVPLILTTHFKAQPDGSGWDPTRCSATW